MSQRTEQVEDSSRFDESYLEALERWYHVPALALLIAFMLWVRLQAFDRFTRNGTVYFGGNDAWYHLRQVSYTVANWPSTMPFDPWTQFPYGTSQGQFGTLYDQLVATAALVVGLGSPDQQTIALTLLVAPAVLGALVAIPTYLIARRLAGRAGGVFAVLLLALLPGTFLARSVVGFSDHHVAEVLFQTLAVAATMAAIAVAEREKPVYELVVGRDYTALREPVGWSVLAGVALAAYVWAWPPGVLLVGILGTYYLLKLTFDQIRGVSPDHVGFVATISMGVGGLLMLVPLGTTSMSGASSFSLLQPVLTLAVAVGAAFMVWLAREWEARDLSPQLYPAPIAGLIGVGSLFVYLALPSLWQTIQGNIIRFIGFGTGARTRTIGEAQPFLSRTGFGVEWYHLIMREYGLLLFTAAIAVALLLWRIYRADRHRGEHLLLIVWTAFITSAAFTQVRFNYYLVVPVAVLNAYLFREVLVAVGLGASSLENVRDVSGYQVVTLLFVVLVLVPGLLVPITYGQGSQRSQTVVTAGAANGPADVTQWHSSLGWMEENTPNEGTFGGADNGMAHYGTYDEGDGNYDYPEGSYGVMSWWDYGHWITTLGERIPNANPFQQQARTAAEFLLAQDEDKAESVMESVSEDDAKSRYVAVDWKMASTYSQINGKFFAPTVFHENFSQSDFSEPLYVIQDEQVRSTGLQIRSQNYYDSQVAQLYLYHGSAVEPEPVVVDWDTRMLQTTDGDEFEAKIVPSGPNASLVQRFDSMEEARTYVEEDGSSQVGGLGRFPSERIPALEHYRLVHASEENALNSQRYFTMVQREMSTMPDEGAAGMLPTSPSWVKLFERVPGATVEGTGPANTTVTASVRMQVPTTGETFTYTQRAETDGNGEFTMVLPYSTTGYDEWGPENGYTNVSVRAAGPYEFATPEEATDEGFVKYNATADVSEAKVIGEDEEPVTVELTESVYVPEGARNNSSANNSSENSSTDGNSSLLTFVGGDLPDLTRLPGEATAPTDGGPDAPAVDVAARVAP
jgi:dolichyl-diphosphooligosaccharide--protein glycosyltransferase